MAVILFAYSFISYSTTIQVTQSQSVVDQVSNAVDFVYAKGPGNTVLIDIKLPSSVTNFRVDQNYVLMTFLPPVGEHFRIRFHACASYASTVVF